MKINIFKILSCAGLLAFSFSFTNAQEVLKVEDAISIGLKNNYDIQISKNDADIGRINNTAGASGMNPNVNLNMGANYALNTYEQMYATGTSTSGSNANLRNYTANIALSWTIFDGAKMFITKEKLDEMQKLGELKYKNQVQQTVYQIISAYYDIVKQKQQLNTILEIKALSAERKKLGETRFNAGMSAKTEILQAEIDFNTQYQNEIQQYNAIADSKRKLNQIINRDLVLDFNVDDDININKIDSANAESKILESNPGIVALKKQISIYELVSKELYAANYPTVSLGASYGLSLAENSVSSMNYNRNVGPYIGATLSMPLYQGGNITRQIENSELNVKALKLQLEALKSQAKAQYQTAINQYITQSKLLEIEAQTTIFAKENLNLAMERLKLSQTTSIEVRDAQLSYENSQTRYSNISYNLKLAETQIKLLMGEL